jgi:hypothetical protein
MVMRISTRCWRSNPVKTGHLEQVVHRDPQGLDLRVVDAPAQLLMETFEEIAFKIHLDERHTGLLT